MAATSGPLTGLTSELVSDGESIFTASWFLIPNWKWMLLFGSLFLGLMILRTCRWGLDHVRKSIERRFLTHELVGLIFHRPIQRPLSGIITAFFWMTILDELQLPHLLDNILMAPTKIYFGMSAIILGYMAIDALGQSMEILTQRTRNTLNDHLVAMATRMMKALVVIFGVLAILQSFGVNVMSILAGLGLGGLALALAAQDTAANLFGTVMIILDRPFQVGDWIKVGDTQGGVEEVGLRSTRLRTSATSVVTIPNSVMAKEKIENVGARRTTFCKHSFGLSYGTPSPRIQEFIDRIRGLLKNHPKVQHDTVFVNLSQLGESTLTILTSFHIETTTAREEVETQEAILFGVLQVAELLNISFAYPTRTLHFVGSPIQQSASTDQ